MYVCCPLSPLPHKVVCENTRRAHEEKHRIQRNLIDSAILCCIVQYNNYCTYHRTATILDSLNEGKGWGKGTDEG